MNKKIILILVSIVCVVLTIGIIYFSVFYEPKEGLLEPIGTAEIIDTNLNAPGEADTDLPVFIMNSKTLFAEECDMSSYAKRSLEEYMCRYLSYYLTIPKGTVYYGDYIQGSFRDDINTPSFKIKVEMPDETSLTVTCLFNNTTERYTFESKLNEEN